MPGHKWGRWQCPVGSGPWDPQANNNFSELWSELQGLGVGVPCPGWQAPCTEWELETLGPFS